MELKASKLLIIDSLISEDTNFADILPLDQLERTT